jgi:hypothetical protein
VISNKSHKIHERATVTSIAVALANWNKSAYVTPEYLSLIGLISFNALTSPNIPSWLGKEYLQKPS